MSGSGTIPSSFSLLLTSIIISAEWKKKKIVIDSDSYSEWEGKWKKKLVIDSDSYSEWEGNTGV